jgi:hypothetical protein
MIHKSTIVKVLLIITIVLLIIWFNQAYLQLTPTDIRIWILSFGWGTCLRSVVGNAADGNRGYLWCHIVLHGGSIFREKHGEKGMERGVRDGAGTVG